MSGTLQALLAASGGGGGGAGWSLLGPWVSRLETVGGTGISINLSYLPKAGDIIMACYGYAIDASGFPCTSDISDGTGAAGSWYPVGVGDEEINPVPNKIVRKWAYKVCTSDATATTVITTGTGNTKFLSAAVYEIPNGYIAATNFQLSPPNVYAFDNLFVAKSTPNKSISFVHTWVSVTPPIVVGPAGWDTDLLVFGNPANSSTDSIYSIITDVAGSGTPLVSWGSNHDYGSSAFTLALQDTPPPVLPGQVERTTTGITDWVVPPGVTSICAVCIGAGGNGAQIGSTVYGGGGGGLAYKNNIIVVPGNTIRLNTSSNPVTLVDITAGSITLLQATAGSPGGGAPSGGGAGSLGNANFTGGGGNGGFGGTYAGGGAGTYTANGGYGAGTGTSVKGTTGGGTLCGAGGNSSYSSGATAGGPAGVRLIWGDGRSYPSNAA